MKGPRPCPESLTPSLCLSDTPSAAGLASPRADPGLSRTSSGQHEPASQPGHPTAICGLPGCPGSPPCCPYTVLSLLDLPPRVPALGSQLPSGPAGRTQRWGEVGVWVQQ